MPKANHLLAFVDELGPGVGGWGRETLLGVMIHHSLLWELAEKNSTWSQKWNSKYGRVSETLLDTDQPECTLAHGEPDWLPGLSDLPQHPTEEVHSPEEIINLDVCILIIQDRSLGFLSLENAVWVTLFAFGNTMKNKNATNS